MADSRMAPIIGKSVVIKGELTGAEDLVIEGRVDGNINLSGNVLTVGEHGKVNAKIVARTVFVAGQVRGSITASDKVDIRNTSLVEADISAPRVAIESGADVRGSVEMGQSRGEESNATSAAEVV